MRFRERDVSQIVSPFSLGRITFLDGRIAEGKVKWDFDRVWTLHSVARGRVAVWRWLLSVGRIKAFPGFTWLNRDPQWRVTTWLLL